MKKIGGLVRSAERFFDIIDDSFLDYSQRLKLKDIIKDRFEVLM